MSTSFPADPPDARAEAARYALLRRLSASMRHHLVVNLQPIGMIYEVMERRLRAPVPDLASVRDSAGKINTFARAALASCIDVVGWLAPDEDANTTLEDGTRESAGLLATSLSFRGYALRNEVGPLPGTVRRSALRHLLTATLLYCTDHAAAPADLLLVAAAEPGAARLAVTLRVGQGEKGIATQPNYRRITWEDLQALAAADGVQIARDGDAVTLRFPWSGDAASAA